MSRLTARLHRDERGATIVEFAIVLPVMLLAIMALMELSYQIYVQSVLTGAVQKAGRDSGIAINVNSTRLIDAQVEGIVKAIAGSATFNETRVNYVSFQQIGRVAPEPFVDSNGNGRRDAGECFDDINGNGIWDTQATSNTGTSGTGGASDVVVYTVTASYPRLFPLGSFLGWPNSNTLSATTILRNQPYASQSKPEQTICA